MKAARLLAVTTPALILYGYMIDWCAYPVWR